MGEEKNYWLIEEGKNNGAHVGCVDGNACSPRICGYYPCDVIRKAEKMLAAKDQTIERLKEIIVKWMMNEKRPFDGPGFEKIIRARIEKELEGKP